MDSPKAFEKTTFREIYDQVDRFEKLLLKKGIQIRNGSELEHGCLILKQLFDDYLNTKQGIRTLPNPVFRENIQLALGILNIIQLVLKHASSPDFEALLPHIRILGDGSLSQTKASAPSDQVSNKLFELRIALACLHSGYDLKLDNPLTSSGGSNPDILCSLKDGRRWGFACKVVHGDAPMSLYDRFLEGVNQIERSDADIGMVVISLKNKIPHSDFFPVIAQSENNEIYYGVIPEWSIAHQTLSTLFELRVTTMVEHVGRTIITESLQGKKVIPCISCPLETAAMTDTTEGILPSFFSYLHTVVLAPQFNSTVMDILSDINCGLVPGRPSR